MDKIKKSTTTTTTIGIEERASSAATALTLQILKDTNPLLEELLDELKQIKLGLYTLHDLKLQHRRKTAFGSFHRCRQCEIWSRAQEHLRQKRTEICGELQRQSYGLDPMTLLAVEEEVDNY